MVKFIYQIEILQKKNIEAGAFGIRMEDTGGFNRWNIERNYGGYKSTTTFKKFHYQYWESLEWVSCRRIHS